MTSMVARLRMMRKNLPRSCIGLHLPGTVRRIFAEKAVYRGPSWGALYILMFSQVLIKGSHFEMAKTAKTKMLFIKGFADG